MGKYIISKFEKLIDFLEEVSVNNITSFYPSAFSEYAGISLQEAFEVLAEHQKTNQIKLFYRIKCSHCWNDVDEIPSQEVDSYFEVQKWSCKTCEGKTIPDKRFVFPIFVLNSEFMEYKQSTSRHKKASLTQKQDV